MCVCAAYHININNSRTLVGGGAAVGLTADAVDIAAGLDVTAALVAAAAALAG